MNETDGAQSQSYDEQQAELYSLVPVAEDPGEKVERSVNRWLLDKLNGIGHDDLIGDFGCGDGRLISLLRGGRRKILGVDISAVMLSRVPGPDEDSPRSTARPPPLESAGDDAPPPSVLRRARTGSGGFVLRPPVTVGAIREELSRRSEVFAEASIEDLLPRMGREGLLVDTAISSFNAVCFSTPGAPVGAIAQALRSGGSLLYTSNALVPSETLAAGWSRLSIDLHSPALHARSPARDMFRHVLHTQNGPVPLEDHVHSVGLLAAAFNAADWALEEVLLFPPEGCEHLHASDERYAYAYGHQNHGRLLSPDEGFSYVKVVAHARRR